MPAPTDDCRSYSVSFDSLWYYTAMLYDYDHFSTLTLLTKIDRQPNQWRDVNFISRGHQVHTECICTWLSTGFFLRTIFAIEMNGKNRPSREFRPFPQNRLALKSYSYAYKFLRLGLAQGAISVLFFGGLSEFLTIFRKIHQNSTFAQGIVSTLFNLKIQFQVVWVPKP